MEQIGRTKTGCQTESCPLPKTAGSDENGDNDEWASCPQNKGFAAQTPENDENDENGGCPARKDPVCPKNPVSAPPKTRHMFLATIADGKQLLRGENLLKLNLSPLLDGS